MVRTAIYQDQVDKAKQISLNHGKDIKLAAHQFTNIYGTKFMATRNEGILKGRAFVLNVEKFNWLLGKDDKGVLCLIPRKKS
jgi:hypothetical protein